MKKATRLLAASLALIFLCGLLPATALTADETNVTEQGTVETVVLECTASDGCEAELHREGCPMGEPAPDTDPAPPTTPEAYSITVNIKYVARTGYNSGGSQYDKGSVVEEGEAQVFPAIPGEENTLALALQPDEYVLEASFGAGNTNTSVQRDIDGSVSLLTTPPEKDTVITVKVGRQWTSRVYVYNMVLANNSYDYQFPQGISATVLMPKGADASTSFAADGALESAYLEGNLRPAISGDYEYARRYYVTYYNGDTGENLIVADSTTQLDSLSDYGLDIDPQTGEISSLDGETSPTLTGNQYFSVLYYFNRPGEAEQGNLYTYSLFEDAEGVFPYNGKMYRLDAGHNTQAKWNIGTTATHNAPAVANYLHTGSELYQFNAAGQWERLSDTAFDFTVADSTVSVTAQRGYLAFYHYYDAATTVTVNRVYDSAYSATPIFDEQSDFATEHTASVAVGKDYTVSAVGEHEGYTLVPSMTKVEGGAFTGDDSGTVTVTPAAGENVTVTYYYYRELKRDEPTTTTYRLTVNYVDENGEPLAAAYTKRQNAGSRYDLTERAEKRIEGYVIDRVEGDALTGTVRGAVTVTVYYVEEASIPPVEPPITDKPEVDEPEVEIPEVEPPLTDLPEIDTPEVEIPEEDVPLAPLPDGEVTITDPETPLGNLPQTGTVDASATLGTLVLAMAIAAAGVSLVTLKRKRNG